jgi:hypothetical protein
MYERKKASKTMRAGAAKNPSPPAADPMGLGKPN